MKESIILHNFDPRKNVIVRDDIKAPKLMSAADIKTAVYVCESHISLYAYQLDRNYCVLYLYLGIEQGYLNTLIKCLKVSEVKDKAAE